MSRSDKFRRKLVRQLVHHGWEVLGTLPLNYGELWTLQSLWSPGKWVAHLALWRHYGSTEPTEITIHTDRSEALLAAEVERPYHYWSTPLGVGTILSALAAWRDERAGQIMPAGGSPATPTWGEAFWETASDVDLLLPHLRDRLSGRKWRLFACACLRRLPLLMEQVPGLRAVEAMERYADGLCPRRDMKKARKAARIPWLVTYEPADEAEQSAGAFRRATLPHQHPWLCELLRDLAGNPFRPVTARASWLHRNDGAVAHLARVIYDERRFEDLAVLADALEDAGCAHAELLAHCRSGGEHVRGCWALDLLLGKS
jgi:hypothetical protein